MSFICKPLIQSLESRSLLSADVVALGQQALLADMNGDGRADRVAIIRSAVSTVSGGVMISLGDGHGNFRRSDFAAFNANTAFTIAVGDLDGDGKNDVAIAGDNPLSAAPINGTNVLTFFGNGDGKFKRSTLAGPNSHFTFVPEIARANALSLSDVDHDGFGDVSVLGVARASAPTGSTNLAISVHWSPTLLTLVAVPPTVVALNALASVNALQSADLDGDGKSDLVAFRTTPLNSLLTVVQPDLVTVQFPTGRVPVVKQGLSQLFYPPPPVAYGTRFETLGVADLNHDNIPELVGRIGNSIRYASYDRASNAFGIGHGALASGAPTAQFGSVLIGDINGDGLPDLLASTSTGSFVGANVSNATSIGFRWHRVVQAALVLADDSLESSLAGPVL